VCQPLQQHDEDGRIIQFLRRNYFLVELRDRQLVAAMPEHLLAVGAKFKELSPGQSIRVKVRLRRPPRMARITDAHLSVLVG